MLDREAPGALEWIHRHDHQQEGTRQVHVGLAGAGGAKVPVVAPPASMSAPRHALFLELGLKWMPPVVAWVHSVALLANHLAQTTQTGVYLP